MKKTRKHIVIKLELNVNLSKILSWCCHTAKEKFMYIVM